MLIFFYYLLEIVRSKSNNLENLTNVVLSDAMMFQIKGCSRCLSTEVHYNIIQNQVPCSALRG